MVVRRTVELRFFLCRITSTSASNVSITPRSSIRPRPTRDTFAKPAFAFDLRVFFSTLGSALAAPRRPRRVVVSSAAALRVRVVVSSAAAPRRPRRVGVSSTAAPRRPRRVVVSSAAALRVRVVVSSAAALRVRRVGSSAAAPRRPRRVGVSSTAAPRRPRRVVVSSAAAPRRPRRVVS